MHRRTGLCVIRRGVHLSLAFALTLLSACAQDVPELSPPSPDFALFREQVYPVLLRDCGFPQCHGSEQRFFQVVGPGRRRLGPAPAEYEPTDVRYPLQETELVNEVVFTYQQARSMLTRSGPEGEFFLLRKALEVGAGGAGHKGTDRLGRNVYLSREDPAWMTLQSWAFSAQAVSP